MMDRVELDEGDSKIDSNALGKAGLAGAGVTDNRNPPHGDIMTDPVRRAPC